jgi:hypothetical protein
VLRARGGRALGSGPGRRVMRQAAGSRASGIWCRGVEGGSAEVGSGIEGGGVE